MTTQPWILSLAIAVDWITFVFSAISIVCCGLLLLTFLSFKVLRSFAIKLVCYLCICIMGSLICFLLTFELANTFLCYPLAIGVHFFFLSNFTWSFVIAFNFYQAIVRRKANCEPFEKWYHIAAWIIPLIIVVVVGATGSYGPIGLKQFIEGDERYAYCYINEADAVFWGLLVPGIVVVAANVVLFVFVAREIHAAMQSGPQADKRRRRREFRLFASIFVSIGLAWIFGFIGYFFPDPNDADAALAAIVIGRIFNLLFNVCVSLQGFLLFESYCVNRKVWGYWCKLLGIYIPCFKQWEHHGNVGNR